jgi:hypothetical protein
VPDTTPFVAVNVRPVGKVPADTLNVYGLAPPLAVTVWLYGVPVVPFGKLLGATVTAAQVNSCTVYDRLPVQPYASVAVIVKVLVPGLPLYVPEITPVVLLKLNPLGNDPLLTL